MSRDFVHEDARRLIVAEIAVKSISFRIAAVYAPINWTGTHPFPSVGAVSGRFARLVLMGDQNIFLDPKLDRSVELGGGRGS